MSPIEGRCRGAARGVQEPRGPPVTGPAALCKTAPSLVKGGREACNNSGLDSSVTIVVGLIIMLVVGWIPVRFSGRSGGGRGPVRSSRGRRDQ